jgi:hypothetical protein
MVPVNVIVLMTYHEKKMVQVKGDVSNLQHLWMCVKYVGHFLQYCDSMGLLT